MIDNNKISEIYLGELIGNFCVILWKSKVILISVTFLFFTFGFLYTNFFINKVVPYKISHIILREAPDIRLGSEGLRVRSYIGSVQDLSIDSYMDAFTRNLKSIDNLEKFIEEEEIAISFKKYLKLQGITTREFLSDKFRAIDSNKFYFIFPNKFEGDIYLNEYIYYTKRITTEKIVKNLKRIMRYKLSDFKRNLEIAKRIGLDNPLLVSDLRNNGNSSVTITSMEANSSLYYRGAAVLKEEIRELEKIINLGEQSFFDFEPILDRATKPEGYNEVRRGHLPYYFLVLGFIVSLILVVLKNLYEKSLVRKKV